MTRQLNLGGKPNTNEYIIFILACSVLLIPFFKHPYVLFLAFIVISLLALVLFTKRAKILMSENTLTVDRSILNIRFSKKQFTFSKVEINYDDIRFFDSNNNMILEIDIGLAIEQSNYEAITFYYESKSFEIGNRSTSELSFRQIQDFYRKVDINL
ncbi:hypothetical protein [Fulvivirga kasyanovii]|uniref:hypothetical protein n=2 Tax=Fulvivirga kasyanovii TaxID=396812 RepID=UPI0031CE4762